MKRLCIMRHAKSDWSDPTAQDSQRTLNERGKKSAVFLANLIIDSGWTPDHALCSTAIRARSTIAPLAERLGSTCEIDYRDDLYMAMPDGLLDIIKSQDDAHDALLIVAHNPGLEMLGVQLADATSADAAAQMEDHFPTGTLVVFEFAADHWVEIASGTGHVVFFGRPRELMADANA
ncbi:MAG: histidine phosphatase family protein [Parvibaculum sp.]